MARSRAEADRKRSRAPARRRTTAASPAALAVLTDAAGRLPAGAWTSEEVARALREADEAPPLPQPDLVLWAGMTALRNPALLELPPRLAIEEELAKLHALAPVTEVSFWLPSTVRASTCFVHIGTASPTRAVRSAARRALAGVPASTEGRASIHGVAVVRWQKPVGAIVVRVRPRRRETALALTREAAAFLAPLLEKQSLLDRSAEREALLVESTERRLTRLGFDLHDGALQDLAALAGDLRLFRSQLGESAGGEHRERLVGRVDDLEAQIVAIDAELRHLARSFEPLSASGRRLEDALAREVEAFRRRAGIEAELAVVGKLTALSASQQIALLRIVREALTNVREHSGAETVRVSIVGERGRIRAEIVDDGCGFTVEKALLQAARRGRLGLVGMSERIRLLGGLFDVQSRPGGPTTILVTLPEWRPLRAGAVTAPVAAGSARG